VTIDFQGFRKLVDALGGVDVNVEKSFSADYPANDDPNVDASWTTVTFEAGKQHMDGEEAIRYARARYSDDPTEGTDFARAHRQQLVVQGILSSVKSPTSWPRLFGAMDAVKSDVYTNLSPIDLLSVMRRLDGANSKKIVLDESNVLESSTSDDGQSIVIPKNGDWAALQQYVQEQLAGSAAS
jgi:anionic cell wall polymer biosynthesis LytR-Cps2A-Psr (LCP) family protein